MVTGPSFNKLTFISAPKIPVWTTEICFLHSLTKYSYRGEAISDFAALEKEGLFPLFLQSPYSVNCEIINSSPFTSYYFIINTHTSIFYSLYY